MNDMPTKTYPSGGQAYPCGPIIGGHFKGKPCYWTRQDGHWEKGRITGEGIPSNAAVICMQDNGAMWIAEKNNDEQEGAPPYLEPKLWTEGKLKSVSELMTDGGGLVAKKVTTKGLVAAVDGETIKLLLNVEVNLAIPTDSTSTQPPSTNAPGLAVAASPQQVDLMDNGAVMVPKSKKATEGGWLVLNCDDDDDDGRGVYSDGVTSALPDYANAGAVAKENDLIRVGIKKIEGSQVSYRFKFSNDKIRLWKKADRSEPIVSEQTEIPIASPMEYAVAHIEGIKPHDDDEGTLITGQVKIANGNWQNAETVKVRVARPIICVWADMNDWLNDQTNLAEYLTEQVGQDTTRKRQLFSTSRSTPAEAWTFLIAGKNRAKKKVCYSVTVVRGTTAGKALKLALKTEGTDIAATGHANFGVGLAFGKNFDTYNQFFNMAGGGTTAVAYNAFGNHPLFSVQRAAPSSHGLWDPVAIARINAAAVANPTNRALVGIPFPNVDRFPHRDAPQGPVGGAFTVHHRDYETFDPTQPSIPILVGTLTWHLLEDALLIGGEPEASPSINTIISCGSQDVPPQAQLKYRSLMLSSCNGLRNFAESFKHGTVFAARESVAPEVYTKVYVEAIVDGKDWAQVQTALAEVALPKHPTNASRKLYEKLSY